MNIVRKRPFFRKKVRLDPKGLKEAEMALGCECLPQWAEGVLQAYFRTVKGSVSVPKKERS